MHLYNYLKHGICGILVLIIFVAACEKKEFLPQFEFPLSQETVEATLEEAGLTWEIEQAATPRQAARSSRGKSLTLFLYESEEAYQHFLQMSKQAKAENLSEVQQHK